MRTFSCAGHHPGERLLHAPDILDTFLYIQHLPPLNSPGKILRATGLDGERRRNKVDFSCDKVAQPDKHFLARRNAEIALYFYLLFILARGSHCNTVIAGNYAGA